MPMPPVFALAGQLDAQAKYMLELNWAPLVGAAVVRKKSWDRIPAESHAALLAIATEIGQQVKAAGRAESEASVAAMAKRGLKVQKVSPEVDAEWRAVLDKLQDRIRGKIVPAEMFDEAQQALKEYRAGAGATPK
jgi:TRAP-type C4-dicarboxylate transport system substrate-binding protein